MLNPTLSDLIGGIQAVTLGDEEARRRGTQKTVLERKAPATFDVLVEIQSWDEMAVYQDVASAVDAILRGDEPEAEQRTKDADGNVVATMGRPERHDNSAPMLTRSRGGPLRGRDGRDGHNTRSRSRDTGRDTLRDVMREFNRPSRDDLPARDDSADASDDLPAPKRPDRGVPTRIFPFGVSRNRLEKSIEHLNIPATLVREMDQATMVVTLKNYYRQNPSRLRSAEERGIPVYVLRSNTQNQMEEILASVFDVQTPNDPLNSAIEEVEEAINQVLEGVSDSVELTPQNTYIRRLQHQMVERYNLQSESTGKEPRRRLRIYR